MSAYAIAVVTTSLTKAPFKIKDKKKTLRFMVFVIFSDSVSPSWCWRNNA